ncbi:MAG: hypothetical protein JWM90_3118 [Thermoleophilia bacterium]|nr:hypothetical protein [Thermoleophilia bacterium]
MAKDEDKLQRFLDRAAPSLRKLDEVISGNETLSAAREAVADRVADASKQAIDALRGTDTPRTVEGEVRSADATPVTGVHDAGSDRGVTPATPATTPPPTSSPTTKITSSAHWDRARLTRMAAAAGREAIRPAAATPERLRAMRSAGAVTAAFVASLIVWNVLRRR